MLVSQRAEVEIVRLLGTQEMKKNLEAYLARQRGAAPTPLEGIVVLYVFGFVWEEIKEVSIRDKRALIFHTMYIRTLMYIFSLLKFQDVHRRSKVLFTGHVEFYRFHQKHAVSGDRCSQIGGISSTTNRDTYGSVRRADTARELGRFRSATDCGGSLCRGECFQCLETCPSFQHQSASGAASGITFVKNLFPFIFVLISFFGRISFCI